MFIDSSILSQIGCCQDGIAHFKIKFPNGHYLGYILRNYNPVDAAWLVTNLRHNNMLPDHYALSLPFDTIQKNHRYMRKNWESFLKSIPKNALDIELGNAT